MVRVVVEGLYFLFLFLFYICLIKEKCFEKEKRRKKIKSAGDFVKFAEEGKECGSENDKRKEKLNRVRTRFVRVFDVKIIDELLGVVEFIG